MSVLDPSAPKLRSSSANSDRNAALAVAIAWLGLAALAVWRQLAG
jgi:hypothetical protein